MHYTRLDIALAMCNLSRFTSNPSTMHWKAIVRVLRYLKRTKDLGIFYQKFSAILEDFTDASRITSATNNKSTSGQIFTLDGVAISCVMPPKY